MELLLQSAVAFNLLCLLVYGVGVLAGIRHLFRMKENETFPGKNFFFLTRLVQGAVTIAVCVFLAKLWWSDIISPLVTMVAAWLFIGAAHLSDWLLKKQWAPE